MSDKDGRLRGKGSRPGGDGPDSELDALLDEVLRDKSLFDEDEDDEEYDLEYDGGDEEEPPRPKKKGKAGLIIGLLALAIALAAGGLYFLSRMGGDGLIGVMVMTNPAGPESTPPPTPTPIPSKTMPDLALLPQEEAEGMLAAEGLEADIIYVPSANVPKGMVAVQSVSPGNPIAWGEELVLYVSLGPAPTPTPEPTPLPTPTPKPTARPRPTEVPVIVAPTPEVTPCPTG